MAASSQNSFYTDLVSVNNFGGFPGGPAVTSLTITGNTQAYSYTGLNPNCVSFLESLDGLQFLFQDNQGAAGVFNIGSAAGRIVVIPESSAALCLLAAPFVPSLHRRRP